MEFSVIPKGSFCGEEGEERKRSIILCCCNTNVFVGIHRKQLQNV